MSNATPTRIDCYVINLDRATDRWARLIQSIGSLDLNVIRVPAIDGKQIALPHPDYSEKRYQLYHGKRTNSGEIGCFFSHLKALRLFLESDKEHALVCEDDVSAKPELVEVISAALKYEKSWDMLRLNGLHVPFQCPVADLKNGYKLCIPLTWFGGSGAYMVNRKAAAKIMKHVVPMRVPYDHAFEQNWLMGFCTASVRPFPIQLNETSKISCIDTTKTYKLPFFRRYITVLPYRGIMTLGRWGAQISSTLKRLVKI